MSADIVGAVRAAGIVGAGGGGFPTHVKLSARAEAVIGNGVECEPLMRSDRHLLMTEAGRVLRGLRLAMAATGAQAGYIVVKGEAREACGALQTAIGAGSDVRLVRSPSYYPAGDEFLLVQAVLGRAVPEGGLPIDVGAVVQNVATLSQIADAQEGKPVVERRLTVVGEVKRPCTLTVPLGTRVRDVLGWAGGLTLPEDEIAVVGGGPMMGKLIGLDVPTTKTLGGLLVLPRRSSVVEQLGRPLANNLRRGRSTCDQCRDCTELCPRFLLGHALQPHEIMRSINYGLDAPTAIVTAAVLCSECRLCEAYACPLGLSPMSYYRACKAELRQQGWRNTQHRRANLPPREEAEYRHVPVHRLLDKLGLAAYAQKEPALDRAEHRPNGVTVLLRQHAGQAARPVVTVGTRVQRGDLLGEIPEGQLGACVHASVDGVVTAVTADAVVIGRR